MPVAQEILVREAMKFDRRHIICERFVRISSAKMLSEYLLSKKFIVSNLDATTILGPCHYLLEQCFFHYIVELADPCI